MQRTTRLALAGVTGATIAFAIIGDFSHFSLIKSFNSRACDEQALEKIAASRLPSNGNTGYDTRRELCVYNYTNSEGNPDRLTWTP